MFFPARKMLRDAAVLVATFCCASEAHSEAALRGLRAWSTQADAEATALQARALPG